MEVIVELLLHLVLQVFGEVLFEGGYRVLRFLARGTYRLIGRPFTPRVRRETVPGQNKTLLPMLVLGDAIGLAFGWWWGKRQSNAGLDHIPYTLWWSLVLGGLGIIILVAPGIRGRLSEKASRNAIVGYLIERSRLMLLVALNFAIAAGIAIGWWT